MSKVVVSFLLASAMVWSGCTSCASHDDQETGQTSVQDQAKGAQAASPSQTSVVAPPAASTAPSGSGSAHVEQPVNAQQPVGNPPPVCKDCPDPLKQKLIEKKGLPQTP